MAVRRGQKLKLFYIVDILKQYSDEEHPLSANEICDKLAENGVTAERKAIYDDIRQLIDYGYDIIPTRLPKSGYFLASREFETPEIYLLGDAVRTAKFITPKKSRELVKKLQNMLSDYQKAGIETGIYIDSESKCNNEEIFYNIDTISNAIKLRKKVSLKYCSRILSDNREIKESVKEMKISPYALTWQDDHYYLVGNYEKYNNTLHLRIDRMKKVTALDEPSRPFSEVSDYDSVFDIADYTKRMFSMYGGKMEDISLSCDKSILEQIVDRFGEKICITDVTDSSFTFTAKAVTSEAFITFVMNYGDKMEILKPEHLRDEIKDRAGKILKKYK